MKTVVITGSTRGIGFGLADAFLAKGCRVAVSGRNRETADAAAAKLAQKYDGERVFAYPCDVSDYAQVQALWDASAQQFHGIDIWINNAGQANKLVPFWELEPCEARTVIDANLIGTMYGCSVALREMLAQGSGAVYNMEGFGSKGRRMVPGLTVYGTTKAATAFLNKSLAEELKGKPVILGSISPGMVVTDLLLNQRNRIDPADWERSKRAFNILADRVETVAPWLVERILNNKDNGAQIAWLSRTKVMWRFLTAPLTKRKVIED